MKKVCVLFPVPQVGDNTAKVLQALAGQTLKDWVCYVLGAGAPDAVAKANDPRVQAGPAGLDTLAKMMNWAVEKGDAELVAPLPDGIVRSPAAFEKFAQLFAAKPEAACAYSSFKEIKPDGKTEIVNVYPHWGCPHERFDFGYIKMYRADRLKEIGCYRTDLVHAAEYDVDLKLCDKYTIEPIDEPLYSVIIPANPADGKASAPAGLHSPGKGKLGGFSYVFYPADLEKEITGVFEETLKRRGAWIDHDTVEVKYPEKPYEVLATVVVPVLNRVKFIGNAIDRVLEGTFQNFEMVVIDNGSTDGTPDEVKKYADKDPRIRLIKGTGDSIASALNDGIRAARGKYICQLDSDDEYKPETLEKMTGHLESHPKCGLAISYYELMNEDRSPVEGIDPVTHSGYTRNQILRRDGAGALRVFPKAVLEEMGLYDVENYGNFGEDYDMVLKVGEKYDVDRVHQVLYRYRRHADNTDVTRDPLMKVKNKNTSRIKALERRKAINKRLGKC